MKKLLLRSAVRFGLTVANPILAIVLIYLHPIVLAGQASLISLIPVSLGFTLISIVIGIDWPESNSNSSPLLSLVFKLGLGLMTFGLIAYFIP